MPYYDANRDLRRKKVKDEFGKLCQYSSSLLFDGLGNSVDRIQVTSSYAEVTNVINVTSSSYADTTFYTTESVIATNNTTTSIFQFPSNTYNSLFVNYLMNDGTNFKAGNVVVLYTTSSVKMSETSTTDIGDVSNTSIISYLSASSVHLAVVNNSSNDFSFKFHCEKI
jgi:hypothetical protein